MFSLVRAYGGIICVPTKNHRVSHGLSMSGPVAVLLALGRDHWYAQRDHNRHW